MPDSSLPPQPGVTASGPADPDHRRVSETELAALMAEGDLLALAEAWRRTAAAAHAVARRTLGPSEDVEVALRLVYADLWRHGIAGQPADSLEAWIRQRTFDQAAQLLRAGGRPCPSPSLLSHLRDAVAPGGAATEDLADPVERILSTLDAPASRALTAAHDLGIATSRHADPDAGLHAAQALAALALEDRGHSDAGALPDVPPVVDARTAALEGAALADLVLGLLSPEAAERVERALLASPDHAEAARLLRRGRRRLEGLPPTSDMGPRVLLGVVAAAGVPGGGVKRDAPRAAAVIDDDVVITVARQSAAGGAPPAQADADTGPIPLAKPGGLEVREPAGLFTAEPAAPPGDADLDVWDVLRPPQRSLITRAVADHETAGVRGRRVAAARPVGDAAAEADPMAVRARRGVGLLVVGTALGMLLGAIAIALR